MTRGIGLARAEAFLKELSAVDRPQRASENPHAPCYFDAHKGLDNRMKVVSSALAKLPENRATLTSVPLDLFNRSYPPNPNGIRVLDLFAGAGGFSLGFYLAGATINSAIEIDDWAAETLSKNHPDSKVLQQDIASMTDAELKNAGADCNVIIGGPPCQGFSIANRKAGDPNDPRNSLFHEFLRAIELVKPTAFLLENVPGLLVRKAASNERVIDIIIRELQNAGYEADFCVLEAQAFGVPQIRPRLFVMGTLHTKPTFPRPTHTRADTSGDIFNISPQLPYVSVWDAISDLPKIEAREGDEDMEYVAAPANDYQTLIRADSTRIYNHVAMKHSKRLVERFSHVKWGESGVDVPTEHQARKRGDYSVLSGKGYSQNNRRMHPSKPCHTIPASFYANFIHPYQNRNFTPREGARIQSFPDWYRFCGKPTVVSTKLLSREERTSELHLCQYNQIGNAVPPLLAYHLAVHLSNLCESSRV